jgi:hypothetical protein
VDEPTAPVLFDADALTINGKRILDWFTNHLLAEEENIVCFGWVVGIGVEFSTPQTVQMESDVSYLCRAIEFHAERVCEKFERVVAVSGTGFYDWNAKQASFPPDVAIETEPVPMDFSKWTPVTDVAKPPPGFMNIHLITSAMQFEHIVDAIDLIAL